jgi:anti-anti-sigma regulatory factor
MNSGKKSPDEGHVVTLTGELTIARAEEIKARLSELLQGAASIRIRVADVSAVDLSCLQLLCSAHRTAAALGKTLTLEGEMPPLLRQVMKLAGFTRQKGCSFSPQTDCLGCGGD